jgi:hypothetical protein
MNTNITNKYLTNAPTIASRCLQSCKELLSGIEQAKDRIAAEFREILESNQTSFKLALNEAEALAWQTDYPQLVFPALAVEKLQTVAARQTRQQLVRRTRRVFSEAA